MKIFKQSPDTIRELQLKPFSQEAYLEGFLLENLGIFETKLDDDIHLIDRQVSFPGKRERIDILLLNAKESPEIIVVEVKKIAEGNALTQLNNYLEQWREKGKNVLADYQDEIERYKVSANVNAVRGMLVAGNLDESFVGRMRENDVQGINISRYVSEDLNDTFIFVDYLPALKGKKAKIKVTPEEFWRGNSKHKDEVESILNELHGKDPEICWEYFQTGISIRHIKGTWHNIAYYLKGNASIYVANQTPKLSEKTKIIQLILDSKANIMGNNE
jgi:hypothetical protein